MKAKKNGQARPPKSFKDNQEDEEKNTQKKTHTNRHEKDVHGFEKEKL